MKTTIKTLLASLFIGIASLSYAETHIITQQGTSFSPASVNVIVGDVIQWVWTSGSHTTTSNVLPTGAAAWDSPLNAGNPNFQYTITVPGVYQYVCTPHVGMGMIGVIIASEENPACSIDPEVDQTDNSVTISINGTGATNPLYSIDWGDDSPGSNLPTDTHVYTQPGTYSVCIVYLDQENVDGCMISNCDLEITIDDVTNPGCDVDLAVTVLDNTAEVSATGTGIENGVYIINWGDGETTIAQEGTHTYNEGGTYDVCVEYTDLIPGGCTAAECTTIEIQGESGCELDLSTIEYGQFDVGVLAAGTGAANPQYVIYWGDDSPNTMDSIAAHTYDEPGEYELCVSYTDLNNPQGCSAESCVFIEILADEPTCTVQLEVTQVNNVFTATAVGSGANEANYIISWGDGSFPEMASTGSHTYANPGEYFICAFYFDTNNETCTMSDCELVESQNGVSVSEITSELASIRVSPNPVANNSLIEYTLAYPSKVTVEVLTLIGQTTEVVFSGHQPQGNNKIVWNADNLPGGVYFLRVMTDKEQQTIKIVK